MGRSNSKEVYPSDETIEEYARFTYLRKSEIRYLFKRLNEEVTGGLITNPQRRFTRDEIEKILPQIQKNPYRDSIYRVFSSRKDGCLGFEDVLDLCSAFSDECPIETRAAWAFLIYDFDDDNQVSLDDLVEAIQRLTGFCEERQIGIDRRSAEQVARMIFEEMGLTHRNYMEQQEFVYFVSKMPEFSHTFHWKI
ncbi:calcium and integrin-binding protein 1-like isoform X2 [Prorops nasuta]|uniref:calcium and integrin-binding protein 1-like isoform X2 n=1 Tax=Prorops nasuta TaxID=863751 RepID=UPI0034CDF527